MDVAHKASRLSVINDTLAVLAVLVAVITVPLAIFSLSQQGSVAKAASLSYQSEWTLVPGGGFVNISHDLGVTPTSAFVWCAVQVSESESESAFGVVAPWTNTNVCSINWIVDSHNFHIENGGEPIYVLVTARSD